MNVVGIWTAVAVFGRVFRDHREKEILCPGNHLWRLFQSTMILLSLQTNLAPSSSKKKKFKGNLDKLQVQEPRLPPATPKENQENFSSLSIEEVCKIVLESSNASCRVDPVPTWLVKSCLDVLAPSISLSTQWWRSRKLEKRCCHPSIKKTWTWFGLQKFPSN